MIVNRPATDDGVMAWHVIDSCRWQLRSGMAGAYGLDFGAVAGFATSIGAMTPLLAGLLPDIERTLITAIRSDVDDLESPDGADAEGEA
ncbi:MAG: hypothetical protein Q8S03_10185 [Brevundimonas sp.]|nr:hypothetical protein [Brevundimonas sp.]